MNDDYYIAEFPHYTVHQIVIGRQLYNIWNGCNEMFNKESRAQCCLRNKYACLLPCLPGLASCLYLLTYLLTPWSTVLFKKLTGSQLVKKFPAFYGTRRFITTITRARHPSLSWLSSIQSITPHHTSWRSILILSSRLRLGLPSGLSPSGFPTKTLHKPLLSLTRATCPVHLSRLDFITRTCIPDLKTVFLACYLHPPSLRPFHI